MIGRTYSKVEDRLFYLAGPYTHKLKRVRDFRANEFANLGAALKEHNITVYSPINHSISLKTSKIGKRLFLSSGFEDWRKDDLLFLSYM